MKKRMIFGILAVLWLGFIFYNSLQDAAASNEMSNGLLEALHLPQTLQHLVRKLAHLFGFMLLGVLVSGAFCTDKKVLIPQALLCLLLCACADETLQLFSLGRSSELRDVWIDFSGATIGTLVSSLILPKLKFTIEKSK